MDGKNDTIGSLIEQLQETNNLTRRINQNRDEVNKENLEDFVVKKSGELVQDALEMVQNMRDFIVSAPTSDDVSALADLINATSSAIDNLNKINIQNKRSDTSIKLKEMDINSKKEN